MLSKIFILFSLFTTGLAIGRHIYTYSAYPQQNEINMKDSGDPLFLTPLIKRGRLSYARNLSRVGTAISTELTSYSGYFTINPKYQSNMFFWYFPATEATEDAPLLLWLQGGPGATDMFGLFVEVGPIKVTSDYKIIQKKYHWAKKYNLLFIDNPVGTGFSFTKSDKGYAQNENDVSKDLYEALQQFLTLFPNIRDNDFYVTGESYAGKYIPAIAYKIHTENNINNATQKINLKGIAIGNGWVDPINQLAYGDLLYQIGLLDLKQLQEFHYNEQLTREHINNKDYLAAFYSMDRIIGGDKTKYPTLFRNITELKFYLNFLETVAPSEFSYFNTILRKPEIRKAIHVGNTTFSSGSVVESHLLADQMESVKDWLAIVMNNYKVLLYNGQLDIICAPVLTEKFLQLLKWKYAEEYKNNTRQIYKVLPSDSQIAGYYRNVGEFYQIIIRNAGHILPFDQPRIAYDMISRFVDGRGY
ncbi:putative serine carboxypeptidase CPVL [Nymphon striatum]|nr:putative serine carboxypeptidase CPVL [Nymphon striatum]